MSMEVHPISIEEPVAQTGPVPRQYPAPAVGATWQQARGVGRYIVHTCVALCAVGVLTLVIGEAWLRSPASPKSILYVYDEELGHRYAPNQMPSPRPLGLFAIDAPPMILDGEGFRNNGVDWTQPVILALGSSEIVGPGVAQDAIWTARLSGLLSRDSGRPVTVYNAGTAAYGPYHSAVVLRRFLEKQDRKPALAIVRVSVADRDFVPWTREQLSQERVNKEQRDFLRQYTLFVPFLFAKAQLQVNSIRAALTTLYQGKAPIASDSTVELAEKMWAENQAYWHQMAALGKQNNVPILFMVSDPYGTDGGQVLYRALREHIAHEPCTSVWMLDNRPFGLVGSQVGERQQAFAEKYTLRYDPHANALQHQIIAEELLTVLKSRGIDVRQPPRCSDAPSR